MRIPALLAAASLFAVAACDRSETVAPEASADPEAASAVDSASPASDRVAPAATATAEPDTTASAPVPPLSAYPDSPVSDATRAAAKTKAEETNMHPRTPG